MPFSEEMASKIRWVHLVPAIIVLLGTGATMFFLGGVWQIILMLCIFCMIGILITWWMGGGTYFKEY
jgi:hypothetical protein